MAKQINVMRLASPLASALVAQVYERNLPISFVIRRKDCTGLLPVIAAYEEAEAVMFDKLLNDVARNLKGL